MKRDEMRCSGCINFDDDCCHHEPSALKAPSPDSHCCYRCVWLMWFNRLRLSEPYYWGDWDSYVRRLLISLN